MAVQSKLLTFVLVGIVGIAGIAGIAASLLWRRPPPAVELTTGTLLTPSRKLEDFSLIDQQGRVFGTANLRGRWSVLFFGYTNCPDFCPTTLTTLAAVQKRLRADKDTVLPQVIFVSVDSKRDTPAHLAEYVPNFDPEFIGLTAADQPSVEAVARTLGVSVSIEPTSDGNYIVNHSALIFVLNPDARVAAVLTGPFSVQPLADDFRRIVAARGLPAGRT